MTASLAPEKRSFQAEVSEVLDIVIHSLYTDKEIFVRELVSNSSDASEKMRHHQLTESAVHQPELPLEITLTVDSEAKTITFADHGLGMTRDELHEYLGTIAHSGSKAFVKGLSEAARKESALIGQFGVGFYSAFMVADRVEVQTRSWQPEGESLIWTSDGKTGYEVAVAEEDFARGTRITLHLREDAAEFAETYRLRQILENYSSFVPFPVMLGEDRINKVEAIWRKAKSEITAEQYTEFYKFSAKAYDEPRYHMHFSADSPIELHALLFVPTENTELWGMGQMEAGVGLYCKNILIDDKPAGLLPEWLRFLRGVIDSADIPLNISRESMQDSSLVKKLNRVVTKRFLKFLDSAALDDAPKYEEFYAKFSRFLKEGIVVDYDHREALAKLLRFESSMTEKGQSTSFADYLTRAKDGQDTIYYLVGKDRASIEAGPYLEAFQARGLEVIYLTEGIDEYLVQHLREFDGKKLASAAGAEVDLPEDAAAEAAGEPLPEAELNALCEYLQEQLGENVEKVAAGRRLISSPVAVLASADGMSSQMRQMMAAMNPNEPLPPVKVAFEINDRHPLIHQLAAARASQPELAAMISAQLYDQALLAAGLLEDRSALVQRGFQMMSELLKK